MKRVLVLALTSLVAFPSVALASNWVQVRRFKDGTVFINLDSLSRDGNTVSYWTRINYLQPRENGAILIKVHNQMNCGNRVVQVKEKITYDSAGKVMTRFENESDSGGFLYGTDNGVHDAIFGAVCSRN